MLHLSIIIPCYNEETRLRATLKDIARHVVQWHMGAEVLVVDDGSTDATVQVAEAMRSELPSLRVIRLPFNKGKGAAVRAGMLVARGDMALFMDADNSTRLREVYKLLPFVEEYGVAIGSRHVRGSVISEEQPWYRRLLGRTANTLIRSLLVPGIYDTQCGFKLFSRKAYRELFPKQRIDGYGFDIEILSLAQRAGYEVKEVPIIWQNSPESRVRPVHDAIRTLRELLRVRRRMLQYRTPIEQRFA